MMVGEYPCCGADLMIALPDVDLPKIAPETCPKCGATVWHIFSRLSPQSFTDEDFRKRFDVNDETKSVRLKDGFTLYADDFKSQNPLARE